MRTTTTGPLTILVVFAALTGCETERDPLSPGNSGSGGAQGGAAGSPNAASGGAAGGGAAASGGAAGGGAAASGGAAGGGTAGSGGAAGGCVPADCKGRPIPAIGCANGATPEFTCARAGNGVCGWTMPRCDPPNDGGTTNPPKGDASDGPPSTGGACRVDSDCRLFDDYCTGCDCRALAMSEPDPTCSGPGVRCFVQPCAGKAAACKNFRCVVAGQTTAALSWHTTCGDPVCQGWRAKPNVPDCSAAQTMGGACKVNGESCDPHDNCNRTLVCADKSPIPAMGGCPRSRRSTKRDIHYLSTEELRRYHDELLQMKLATWRYKDAPARERLGFILDDKEGSVAVDAPRDMVDLYGYTSLAVATLQLQAREIETLRAELEALHRRLDRLDVPRPRAARK